MPSNTGIHPEIQKGLDAIGLPEVQDMIRRLSEHGLAVALPHSHAPNGSFLPLPEDSVAYESGQQVSFVPKNSAILASAVPVGWRWDKGLKVVANCALCDFYKHPGD